MCEVNAMLLLSQPTCATGVPELKKSEIIFRFSSLIQRSICNHNAGWIALPGLLLLSCIAVNLDVAHVSIDEGCHIPRVAEVVRDLGISWLVPGFESDY